ncbi:uncharacterized protein [Linepithema humile]|uniref:uncharacterized protein n=1 Tax=Linepithema humile TaxID=83485 RepID=UPI00351E7485
MSTKLLQANLNHARRAQELFLADLDKRDAGLGVAAEPYRVQDFDPNWVSASNGSVVIRPHLEFLEQLREMGDGIRRCLSHSVLVAGDFNAWHQEWGSRYTNIRGEAVWDWAAGLGLLLQNRGSESTCVHPRGESIVDLTWASPRAAQLVRTWGVVDRESLSDHSI